MSTDLTAWGQATAQHLLKRRGHPTLEQIPDVYLPATTEQILDLKMAQAGSTREGWIRSI